MDIISKFLQEDTDDLGHIIKSGKAYISKLERSNFHPALNGILTLMFSRYPTKQDTQTYFKIKENYARIKSQFIDNLTDMVNGPITPELRKELKAAKRSNVVWFGFDHSKPNIVRFKMEYKDTAWKATLNAKKMVVDQIIERD